MALTPEEIAEQQAPILAHLKGKHARGREIPEPKGINKTEVAYANHLSMRQIVGEILWWAFEPVKFRLAGKSTYTADFLVMMPDCEIQIHETKGFMRGDAAVKLRLMTRLFPMFRLFIVRRGKGGAWDLEERGA